MCHDELGECDCKNLIPSCYNCGDRSGRCDCRDLDADEGYYSGSDR